MCSWMLPCRIGFLQYTSIGWQRARAPHCYESQLHIAIPHWSALAIKTALSTSTKIAIWTSFALACNHRCKTLLPILDGRPSLLPKMPPWPKDPLEVKMSGREASRGKYRLMFPAVLITSLQEFCLTMEILQLQPNEVLSQSGDKKGSWWNTRDSMDQLH